MSKNKRTFEYRVWNVMNMDGDGFGKLTVYMPVKSPEEAVHVIDTVAKFQLQMPEVYIASNAFGLEVRSIMDGEVDGNWIEWWDEDYGDVDGLAESMGVEIGYD